MKKLYKVTFIILAVLISLFILAFAFISPITKWAIEKYSPKYTGRQIKMESLFINLFTGSIDVNGLKMYEADNKNIFFRTNNKLTISDY